MLQNIQTLKIDACRIRIGMDASGVPTTNVYWQQLVHNIKSRTE